MLNYHGSRSYNDLSQYPVIPWFMSYDGFISDKLDETNVQARDFSQNLATLGSQKRLEHFIDRYTGKLSTNSNDVKTHHLFIYSISLSLKYSIIDKIIIYIYLFPIHHFSKILKLESYVIGVLLTINKQKWNANRIINKDKIKKYNLY